MTSDTGTDRKRTVVNWVLALSTIIGAAVVEVYSLMQVMGTAGCTDQTCPPGPGDFLFGLITYGAPVLAIVTIALAFFTARHPRGWVAPAISWTLFIIGFIILAVTFQG
ncbi:hypothetical protein CQY20_09465 [Mycolicibacterium agri]|uniref:Uncharacterized protein n=1 Tax=Mycolicibacterium agri TaxID=36811 RepID=A0A2A7N7E1_MYCAG|nr:hypothetical protein [Mycolicibacterium agri]PEG39770.1 hypothetical protein CQY20_09465 [Mycolicibacterium agri]GFG52518.1 hypothetical protein MAGR_39590 [Mycolicibacterium agri]